MADMFDERRKLEELKLWTARDLATAAVALENASIGRDRRKMGSLAGEKPKDIKRMILLADTLAAYTRLFISGYFIPQFARYHRLRKRAEERGEYSKVRRLDQNVQHFRGPYTLYNVLHEIIMSKFDLPYDSYATVTTMLGLPEEERRRPGGPIQVAVDKDELGKKRRQGYAQRDRMRAREREEGEDKPQMPTFDEALEFAGENAEDIPEPKTAEQIAEEATNGESEE